MGPVICLAGVSLHATPCGRRLGCARRLARRALLPTPSRNPVFGRLMPVVAGFGGLEVAGLARRAQWGRIVDSGGAERWGQTSMQDAWGSSRILLEMVCWQGRRNRS